MKRYAEIWSKGNNSEAYLAQQFDRCGDDVWIIKARLSRQDGSVISVMLFQCADTMTVADSGAAVFLDRQGRTIITYAAGTWEWCAISEPEAPTEILGSLMPREIDDKDPEENGANVTKLHK